MANLSGIGAAQVSAYRAYVIGKDGHFASYRAFVCANDVHAIVWAMQLVDGHDVELWSETRFVIRLNATGKPGAISHEVIDGRMVPKK
jgi:hypothetical protein